MKMPRATRATGIGASSRSTRHTRSKCRTASPTTPVPPTQTCQRPPCAWSSPRSAASRRWSPPRPSEPGGHGAAGQYGHGGWPARRHGTNGRDSRRLKEPTSVKKHSCCPSSLKDAATQTADGVPVAFRSSVVVSVEQSFLRASLIGRLPYSKPMP